ncbi:unnamed protein product [Adineta ricciae]|uniref:F-box domain-containing protein n=1 Tax=Adineta ricciae TaxID=249248 RepID=A0A813NME3_ADIRI|nr:unnamed protein product [Adineta ricciae]CAF0776032.1 unnamed protein product [Adineta ricciae]
MLLELLPTELLLHLFEYLSISDLFRAFQRLNTRFDQLLHVQFRKFHLNFQSMPKAEFHQICQNYLPLIQNQTISLRLSDDDGTPDQTRLFFSLPIQIHQLTHLQSITLTHIHLKQTLQQLMTQCSSLPCLCRLKFYECYIALSEEESTDFFDKIWSLPKLTYCYFGICFAFENFFPNPTVVSTSLQYLAIRDTRCSFVLLGRLCQHTPNLQQLSIVFAEASLDEYTFSSPVLSITRLKLEFHCEKTILQTLLQNLPRLQHLTISLYRCFVDGNEWEEIFRKYLPDLKTFAFIMKVPPPNCVDKEAQMNEMLDTFRTKFWIEERRWFVQYHWYASDEELQANNIQIFTLPYLFNNFNTDGKCILAKSTDPNDTEYSTVNTVRHIRYNSTSFIDSFLSHFRFPNITYISLMFPYDEQIFDIIPRLDRLKTLYISTKADTDRDTIQSQLQILLERTTSLNKLLFGIWLNDNCETPSKELVCSSVEELDVQGFTINGDWRCYDHDQCLQLTQSSLAMQCKTLLIKVENQENVLDLVDNLPNLCTLIVRVANDPLEEDEFASGSQQDILIEWLKENLSSTCQISRSTNIVTDIRIWIQ